MNRNLGIWIFFLVLSLAPLSALADEVNWGQGWALQGAGSLSNPGVIIGFNPQPEPPAGLRTLNLDDPTTAAIMIDADPGAQFTLFIGLYPQAGINSYEFDAGGSPDVKGNFSFMALSDGDHDFNIELGLTSNSGGVPDGSWVGFNPQPEPPAFGDLGNGQGVGFQFGMTSLSTVTLTLRLLETSTGEYVTFVETANPVPLPPALALLPAGLLLIKRYQRSHQLPDGNGV